MALREKKSSMVCSQVLRHMHLVPLSISPVCEWEKSQIGAELSSRPARDDMSMIVSISGWAREKKGSSGRLRSAKKH